MPYIPAWVSFIPLAVAGQGAHSNPGVLISRIWWVWGWITAKMFTSLRL